MHPSIEVVVMWGDMQDAVQAAELLHVAYLGAENGFAVGDATGPGNSVSNGERLAPDFSIDHAQLGVELLPVVVRTVSGGVWTSLVVVPHGAKLVAYGDDGHVRDASQLIADGMLRASDDRRFPYGVPIASGTTLWLSYRGFTFAVRMVAPVDARIPRRGVDWSGLRFTLLSLAAHLFLLALFYCSPPRTAAMPNDLHRARSCYLDVAPVRAEGGSKSDELKRDAYGRSHRGVDDFRAHLMSEALANQTLFLKAAYPPRFIFGPPFIDEWPFIDWYMPRVGGAAPYPTKQLDAALPRVAGGKPEVRGALSKETVRRHVQRRMNEIRFCYEQGLRMRPDLKGRVTVRFVIGPTGVVQRAAVASSDIADARMQQCVTAAFQRITFPAPNDGATVSVTYPFVLSQIGRRRSNGLGELSQPRAVVKPKAAAQRRL